MKSCSLQLAALLLISACFVGTVLAQSTTAPATASASPDARSARELFQEADSYLHRKYQEFNKQKLPFDPKLESKTRAEQKDVAARNAAILAARGQLKGSDLYDLGMLYHMAANSDKAYETMQQFLGEDPKGNDAQVARAVVVVHAVKKQLMTEAEKVTEAYGKNEPLNLKELYGLELLLAEESNRTNDYERMAVHSKRMMAVARRFSETDQPDLFKRDEMFYNSASLLAEAQLKLKNKESAIASIQELARIAVQLPSGNLYKLASNRLSTIDANAELSEALDVPVDSTKHVPDLIATQWIDHEPTKLQDLHGRVVLLDFWAPWCAACLSTVPKLQKWYDAYKTQGLVILGVTNYYGEAEGKTLTPGQELAYLRAFKTKIRLKYGLVVAESSINDRNYGVSSIPMSFLIDRRGQLRLISVGSSEQEIAALGKMIKKLVDEPADAVNSSARSSAKGNVTQQ